MDTFATAGRPVELESWWIALGVVAAATLVGLLLRFVFVGRLRRAAARTATPVDDALIEATRRFWLPLALLVGILLALRFAPIAAERLVLIERVAVSALLLLLTVSASRFVGLRFAARQAAQGEPAGSPSLIQKVVQVAVLVAGTLLILDNAGVQIGTLLTALGVGSIAVALALQPTLSNLFAGIHLSVSKPIRVGDYVELEDGTQGYVRDIGWRVTKLGQTGNSLIVVPNARLSDMRLLNYSMPSPAQAVPVRFTVALGSDLSAVERGALEVAQAVQREVPQADPEHSPTLVFRAFVAGGVECEVGLRTRSMPERWEVVSAFVRRLEGRFRGEGVVISYPQQVVHLRPEPPT